MKNIILSFTLGLLIGIGCTIAYAEVNRIILVDNDENTVGTVANPLYITSP